VTVRDDCDFASAVMTQVRLGDGAALAFKVQPVKLEFLVLLVILALVERLDHKVGQNYVPAMYVDFTDKQ